MPADRFDRLAELDPAAKAAALEVLDEISRPLDRHAIDVAMAKLGISRSDRRRMWPALADLQIIALVKRPDE